MMDQPGDRTGKTSNDFEAYFYELEEIHKSSSRTKRSDSNGTTTSGSSNGSTNGSHHGAEGLSESDEDLLKTPDEGEVEIKWLERAGLGNIATTLQDGQELEDAQIKDATSTLTRSQAAVVKKRIEKLNDTLRKKKKVELGDGGGVSSRGGNKRQSRVPDVRDIFPQNDTVTDGQVHNANFSASENVLLSPPKRPTGRHRKSRTLPDALSSDKALHKFRESSGIADLNTGIKVLSFTHTEPIEVPSVKKGEHDEFLRTQSDSTLDLHAVEETIVRQEDLLKSLSATLPNITIARDKLGVTPVHFLATKDIGRVRQIALIELTAVFDRLNLSYTSLRKSSRKKYKDEGIFGVPLTTVVEHDRQFKSDTDTPLFLQKMVSYLEENGLKEEGMLRVPGSLARVKQLRDEAESRFYDGKFRFDDLRVNDIVGLLKQFLRDLPTPLLTLDYVNAFAAVEKIKDRRKQLQCLNLLVLVLPDIHRATLKLLLKFLGKIVDNEMDNKMSLNNVAMIMAPNLFSVQTSRKKTTTLNYSELNIAAGTCNIMRMLIKYHQILWVVPFKMLEQVRGVYEVENRKAKDKSVVGSIFRKGSKDKKIGQVEAEALGGVIRVMMPDERVWNTVQLSEKTVAGDIVQRFTQYAKTSAAPATTATTTEATSFKRSSIKRRSRRKTFPNEKNGDTDVAGLMMNIVSTKSRFYLYELGGNIGERCLDPDTNMLALARVNPNGEWAIRARTK